MAKNVHVMRVGYNDYSTEQLKAIKRQWENRHNGISIYEPTIIKPKKCTHEHTFKGTCLYCGETGYP